MTNFNSREVIAKIRKECYEHSNGGDYSDESNFDDEEAAAILDSALLAAHPEAGELAHVWMKQFCSGEMLAESALSSKIAAALESAKREEREKLRAFMNGLECQHVDQFVENASIEACMVLGKTIRKHTLDSLAEKEGGR